MFPTPESALELAEVAEQFGIESLWTGEHVVIPIGYRSVHPYTGTGQLPIPPDTPIPDPLIWLSWVAGRTNTVRLCTGVLILAEHHPAEVAKQVATLDVLSGGRVILGVGMGWLKEEFDVLSVPFEQRAGRLEEGIQALRALWTQDEPTFHGQYYSFTKAVSRPRPVQSNLPIVIGGKSEHAARRAGRLGDGFYPINTTPRELEHLLAAMRSAAEDVGRDPSTIEITVKGAHDISSIRQFAELGVERVIVNVGPAEAVAFDSTRLREGLDRFANEVMVRC
jgi:probable F420-dependent oxidoreductase